MGWLGSEFKEFTSCCAVSTDGVASMVGSLAISLAYGLPVQRRRDEIIEFADSIARLVGTLVTPGNAIVDVIPALNYIPESIPIPFTNVRIPVPGMGWKRYAKSLRWMAVRFKMDPYEKALKGFVSSSVKWADGFES